jgi:plasmid stabilization system protein ParE
MTSVVWTAAAVNDIEVIRRYIENFNCYAARAVAAHIIEAIDRLGIHPLQGHPVAGPQLRATKLFRPYTIYYRLSRAGVLILRVRHAARRSTPSLSPGPPPKLAIRRC